MNQIVEELREELEEELRLCIEMLLYNDHEKEYNTLSKNIIDEVFGNNILINYIEMFNRNMKGNLQERSREQRNADIQEVFVICLQSELNNLSIGKLNELKRLFDTKLREKFIF